MKTTLLPMLQTSLRKNAQGLVQAGKVSCYQSLLSSSATLTDLLSISAQALSLQGAWSPYRIRVNALQESGTG
ncbi:hypothetical protein [Undibacterium sp. TJN19]|uniref:hypothetical protein n=1 Tax=Undibacterium sp. TJN19 TaxID=3413055 RepID=UPI003BEF4E32